MNSNFSRLFILVLISVCVFPGMTSAQDDDASRENPRVFYLKHRASDKPIHTISFKPGSTGVDFKNSPTFQGKDIKKGVIVIDKKQNTGIPFAWDRLYNKLYIDRNRNFDLSDDPDNVYSGDRRYNIYNYKNLQIGVTRDNIVIPCECTLSLMKFLGKWNADLQINSVWETEANISGESWNITVSDGSDGIVGNSAHDRILVLPKEKFPDGKMESIEFPKKLLFLQNKAYKIDSSFIKEGEETLLKVELQESEAKYGEIKITGKYIQYLVLSGDNQVILTSPSQTVSIPAGLYREQRLLLQGSGKGTILPMTLKQNININTSIPYEFKAGGPLKNSLDVKRVGNRLNMSYKLVDADNNPIGDQLIDTDSPATVIVYQNGKKIHTDKFQYG